MEKEEYYAFERKQMAEIRQKLEVLQEFIHSMNEPGIQVEYIQHLSILQIGDYFHLNFYGDCFEEDYNMFLQILSQADIAPYISSLSLQGPDEGANGTHNWDLESLIKTNSEFTNLEIFMIQQNSPTDHNRSIVASSYEEEGVLAKLLLKAPKLRIFSVPSAPNEEFFRGKERPLRFMSIDAGYATQSFISNLASSHRFPKLNCLEWGEYCETYMEDYAEQCTPIDSFRLLFTSVAFQDVKRFVWKNPFCSEEEIRELKCLRPDLQLLVVQTKSNYI